MALGVLSELVHKLQNCLRESGNCQRLQLWSFQSFFEASHILLGILFRLLEEQRIQRRFVGTPKRACSPRLKGLLLHLSTLRLGWPDRLE